MLFYSIEFALFFTSFFLLYWVGFGNNLKFQNLLILAGSYFFYAWWDWRFLLLLIGSSGLNFWLGLKISGTSNEKLRRLFVVVAMVQGLGCLLLFKYFNFFIDSLVTAGSFFNLEIHVTTLNLILPLGISFYTFRTISYILDIDNEKINPTNDWVVFFSYVAFFPSLISGPIDRASNLIPQLEKKRIFDYNQAVDGMRQILWGLFKKIIIADNCAALTNQIFGTYQSLPSSSLVLGAFLFTVQVYADFSGYSDMAIGFSRLIGFKISRNFNFPFFAQNIAEFWKKWHISLTSWMTDYVFTPLNFALRSYGKTGLIVAVFINFILVGVWHGANWTFILFGFLHGCYFIPLILKGTINKTIRTDETRIMPSLKEFNNMALTFTLIMLTNILFMASDVSAALGYYRKMLSPSLFEIPQIPDNRTNALIVLIFIVVLILVEWLQRGKEHGLKLDGIRNPLVRMSIYYGLIFCILYFGSSANNQFIYFKF